MKKIITCAIMMLISICCLAQAKIYSVSDKVQLFKSYDNTRKWWFVVKSTNDYEKEVVMIWIGNNAETVNLWLDVLKDASQSEELQTTIDNYDLYVPAQGKVYFLKTNTLSDCAGEFMYTTKDIEKAITIISNL